MNILITGGFGFIGSNLTKHYLDHGHFVTVIDNLSTSSLEQASQTINLNHHKLDFLKIDLSCPNSVELGAIERAVQESTLVHHMASAVGVKFIDRDPHSAIRQNVNITHNLFPLFEKHQKKIVFASTSEVYGETEEARETDVLKIGTPDVLRWGYACGKLMSEFLLKTYTFPHVIARFFNVTGRGQLSEHGMVLPTFIEKVLSNQDIVIYGDGNQYRSFCDIRDAIEMLLLLAHDDVHNGETYNIGNPHETFTIKELADMVVQISGKMTPVQFRPYHEELSRHSGDIFKRRPNTDKIQQYYRFKYTLKDTIGEMLK